MSYFDVVNDAIELCVVTDEDTGMSYLEPKYRMLLRETNMHLPDDAPDEELYEILKLEVEKRNALNNHVHAMVNFLIGLMTESVDPAILQEENELLKNVTEYMQANQQAKDNTVEPEQTEEAKPEE